MMHRDRIAAWRDFFEFGSRFFYQDLDLIEFGCGELQKGAHRFTIIFFSVKSIVRDQSSFFINFNDLTFFSINSPPFNPKTFHITTFIFRENVNCNSILKSYRLYHQCEKKIYILCTYIRIQVPDRKKTLKIQYFCQHIHYILIHYVYLVYKVAISNYEINKSH